MEKNSFITIIEKINFIKALIINTLNSGVFKIHI